MGGCARVGKGLVLAVMIGLAGCSVLPGTKVDSRHHLVSAESDKLFATVYFMRPNTERAMGFSDNALRVALDGRELLTLDKGEYTLVYLRPRVEVKLTLENLTEAGPFWNAKKKSKTYPFSFLAGKTYFVVIEPVDGEFRGVHFAPHEVDLFDAKQAAEGLRAAGQASRAPIPAL